MPEKQPIVKIKKRRHRADSKDRQPDFVTRRKQQMIFKDDLTGLYTEAYFHNLIDKEAIKTHRYHRHISLILFSIDHFEHIDDRFGRPGCELLLKCFGAAVRRNIREADLPCCYGPGVYAIVLPETDLGGAMFVAERLRKKIEQLQIATDNGSSFGVTISAGVSTWARHFNTNSKTRLITTAGQALQQAKDQGSNKVISFRFTQ